MMRPDRQQWPPRVYWHDQPHRPPPPPRYSWQQPPIPARPARSRRNLVVAVALTAVSPFVFSVFVVYGWALAPVCFGVVIYLAVHRSAARRPRRRRRR